jgi:xanthine dehydrogenase large subunit
VNTKIAQVAASVFQIPMENIKVHSTNTFRIANTSPSAASATADLNGKATLLACQEIMKRLTEMALDTVEDIHFSEDLTYENGFFYLRKEKTDLDFKKTVALAYTHRVNLSHHAHYVTPEVRFDWAIAKGHPFAYHVYGTAAIGVTVDCLRGTYETDFVRVVHDFGTSMNTDIDFGQIEGGIVQGIGWMTMEELVYDTNGRLRSNALSTYKIPDIYSVPKEINIVPLETMRDNLAIFNSKAVGEPPLIYGIGAYFAIRNAVKNFDPSLSPPFDAPFTPEKVLMNLYDKI